MAEQAQQSEDHGRPHGSQDSREQSREFAAWQPDRDICPKWAAACQVFRTMLNARREPGVRFCCQVPAALASDLANMARIEGCEATVSANCIDNQVAAVSVVWPRSGQSVTPSRGVYPARNGREE